MHLRTNPTLRTQCDKQISYQTGLRSERRNNLLSLQRKIVDDDIETPITFPTDLYSFFRDKRDRFLDGQAQDVELIGIAETLRKSIFQPTNEPIEVVTAMSETNTFSALLARFTLESPTSLLYQIAVLFTNLTTISAQDSAPNACAKEVISIERNLLVSKRLITVGMATEDLKVMRQCLWGVTNIIIADDKESRLIAFNEGYLDLLRRGFSLCKDKSKPYWCLINTIRTDRFLTPQVITSFFPNIIYGLYSTNKKIVTCAISCLTKVFTLNEQYMESVGEQPLLKCLSLIKDTDIKVKREVLYFLRRFSQTVDPSKIIWVVNCGIVPLLFDLFLSTEDSQIMSCVTMTLANLSVGYKEFVRMCIENDIFTQIFNSLKKLDRNQFPILVFELLTFLFNCVETDPDKVLEVLIQHSMYVDCFKLVNWANVDMRCMAIRCAILTMEYAENVDESDSQFGVLQQFEETLFADKMHEIIDTPMMDETTEKLAKEALYHIDQNEDSDDL
ncbi:hypothetical protein EIN_018180 [Entamoeba invadens IP1]|uniref:hypothetical protein n=1 Tax=Entamoeba invadens IP1 TaxID=370355 RepID=UPI0002C3FA4E|nr:hypothetical protein EIN_018180 [Entamoeba invadens IP1]ELP90469.1 hypothetical protein EIN_018180 [Entamoeba invadens IP1]|eukprot:XP_004257240.1 hypothetical protein EIN_018180 [Entamoeba invadens IP1]